MHCLPESKQEFYQETTRQLEELSNQIWTEITKDTNKPVGTSKTDLDSAYGQAVVAVEANKQCTLAKTGVIEDFLPFHERTSRINRDAYIFWG